MDFIIKNMKKFQIISMTNNKLIFILIIDLIFNIKTHNLNFQMIIIKKQNNYNQLN